MSWIKSFKGHSGCSVNLFLSNGKYIVIKEGKTDLEKSANILLDLKEKGFNVPEIISIEKNKIELEYINGIDMLTYVSNADKNDNLKLIDFIDYYYSTLQCSNTKDFSKEIYEKLLDIDKKIDYSKLKFSREELYNQLPKIVSSGLVHGDFTLENIIYRNGDFYLIDSNPTLINSLEYDGCKILQDLDSLWFVRNQKLKNNYAISCNFISNQLKKNWPFLQDNYVVAFMMMRIIPYCTEKSTKDFLYKEINKLWL